MPGVIRTGLPGRVTPEGRCPRTIDAWLCPHAPVQRVPALVHRIWTAARVRWPSSVVQMGEGRLLPVGTTG
jgi:hypothetical protein